MAIGATEWEGGFVHSEKGVLRTLSSSDWESVVEQVQSRVCPATLPGRPSLAWVLSLSGTCYLWIIASQKKCEGPGPVHRAAGKEKCSAEGQLAACVILGRYTNFGLNDGIMVVM